MHNEHDEITGIQSINQYIEKIGSRIIYHNELPLELQNDLRIIHAEVSIGTRKFLRRGYDVTRNCFYVDQSIEMNHLFKGIFTKRENSSFETFQEYYNYLNGDIYDSANYFQYVFASDDITKYDIDVSRILESARVDCTSFNMLEKQKINSICESQVNRNKKKLQKWKETVCACKELDELICAVKAYKRSTSRTYRNWDFILFNYAMDNPQKNIPLVVQLLVDDKLFEEQDYDKDKLFQWHREKMITMLCTMYDDDSLLDCYSRYHWKRKSEIKAIKQGLSDGSVIEETKKYYDSNNGFFCLTKKLVDTCVNSFYREKGVITYYYDDFSQFAKEIGYDLSGIDLSNAKIEVEDFSAFKMDEKTKLPESIIQGLPKVKIKRYDYKKDEFVVQEGHRLTESSPIINNHEYRFKYFCDFVSFLDGDLSGADLLMCDGLIHVHDFSNINLDGARIRSDIKEKIGILKKEDTFTIAAPITISGDLSNYDVISGEKLSTCQSNFEQSMKKVYYISDLHLPNHLHDSKCRTYEDVCYEIKKIVLEMVLNLQCDDVLLIVGDVSYDIDYFKIFVECLKTEALCKVFFILGNHELWSFEGKKFFEVISSYQDIILSAGMHLIQNSIVFLKNNNELIGTISEDELTKISESHIRERLCSAQIIIFGGIGFSGLNNSFNANNGIYLNTINRQTEIEESDKFNRLYTKIRNALYDREVIIATHMPFVDWARDTENHSGFVYVSGHTHRNVFYDDGAKRIYSDNQVGYHAKHSFAKYFLVDGKYDLFVDYEDGIYQISRNQYVDFFRGKNIQISFCRDYERLYMLKRNSYYCFVVQSDKGKLQILNGGATKQIRCKHIEDCYNKMEHIINDIKEPLDEYMVIQKLIADLIKSIGGCGRIHGAIIDIDFFNHVFVNPNGYKVTGYYATDMRNKWIYSSISGLLKEHRPDLLPAYDVFLSDNSNKKIIVNSNVPEEASAVPYCETDIYKLSNIVKKMQRLHYNVLSYWPEKSNNCEKDKSSNLLPE